MKSNGKSQIMASQHSTHCWELILTVILGMLSLVLLNGCGPKGARTIGSGVTPTTGQISKEDLREQLDNFREFFKATLRQVANELNERVPTNRRMYLEEGEGSLLYGESQQVALNGAKRLEAEIQRIGYIFLKDDVFNVAHKNVTEFAHKNAIRGTFSNVIVYATEVQKGQPNPFLSVLKVPMTPFRAMEGVDRTASAIHQFRDTAERFSDIVAELPESSRWQLQLLLYDLEETDMTKSFLSSLQQFTESSSRLEDSVEKLPEHLREQLTQFVEDIDRKQAGLQHTLQQAEKTTLAVNTTLDKLDKAASSLDTAAGNITETAQAWESAARATGDVVEEFNKSKQSPSSSLNIKEYRDAAEQTSQAANDIKDLLVVLDDFSRTRNYISIVNHLSFRVAGLAILIFVLAVLYRIIAVRLRRPKDHKTA